MIRRACHRVAIVALRCEALLVRCLLLPWLPAAIEKLNQAIAAMLAIEPHEYQKHRKNNRWPR